MTKIEIYTRPGCGYCIHAKRLLQSKGLNFSEYDVYQNPEYLDQMRMRGQGRSFPQVFINNKSIGGFDELLVLEKQNHL